MGIRMVWLCLALTIGLGTGTAAAQEATILGVVADETKGALPGATVTATGIDTGRVFTAVSDERGEYRLRGLPPARYKVTAELAGFSTVVVAEVELLVGQNRTVPFSMRVASLEETVTVTGESPLVDITSTQVGGNVDRRQMEELPLQGRNWMELAMQVRGVTANAVDNTPGVRDRQFQLNLDGQEITQQVAGGGFGQPRFSREAIAEFQVVTNLFDITQGRSLGMQVQAISRSGTNNLNGSVYGFFRDDTLNAKDFLAGRVLPYSNQQIGGAVGGPIIRDRLHYFLSYERENEPNTIFTSPPALPSQSFSFDTKTIQNSFLGRGDWQWTGNDHITARASYWDWGNPFTQVSGIEHPSQAADRSRRAVNVVGTWSKVLTSTKLQEVRIGYTHFDWKNLLAIPELAGTPNYVFPASDGRAAAELPAGVLPEHLERALRPQLDGQQPRHEVRRRVPAVARHRPVAAALARGVRLHEQPARPRAPLPRRRLGRPVALGRDRSRPVRTALRPELRGLDDRHPAADRGLVVRRHLAHEQPAHRQLRRALGCGLGRAGSAAM